MAVVLFYVQAIFVTLYKYHIVALNSPGKLSCSLLGTLALTFSGYIKPKSTGFYCDDRSISHKYVGDTVQTGTLLMGCFIGPVILCVIVEAFKMSSEAARGETFFATCQRLVRKTWFWARPVTIGSLIVLALTELAKTIVSEPRPHFLDTCKPNVTQEVCERGYVSNFTCISSLPTRYIMDSQKSFPSGHTSLSVFVSIFCIWYTQLNVTWQPSTLLKPVMQAILASWAIICSLTRITDRRHHWWDVLAGAVLGCMVALVIFNSTRRSWGNKTSRSTNHCDNLPEVLPENLFNGVKATNYSNSKRQSIRRLVSTSPSIVEDTEMSDYTSSS